MTDSIVIALIAMACSLAGLVFSSGEIGRQIGARSREQEMEAYWSRVYSRLSITCSQTLALISVSNPAKESGHNLCVYVRLQPGLQFSDQTVAEGFHIERLGEEGREARFHKGLFQVNQVLSILIHSSPPQRIAVDALQEVYSWTDEDRGIISIPPTIRDRSL